MINVANQKGLTREEIIEGMAYAAATFKTSLAAPNNAAIAVMLEAHDHVKRHPRYRREVKKAFRNAIEEMRRYRRRLVYDTTNRFFHVADMTPDIRAKYGDITDEQFYEMWEGCGDIAYGKTHDLVNSLHHKYRKSFERNGIPHADTVAWGSTALTALSIPKHVYQGTVNATSARFGIPKGLIEHIFGKFDLGRVCDLWQQALYTLEPMVEEKGPADEIDDRNIGNGIEQLFDAWTDSIATFQNVIEGAEEYSEVFASKKHLKETVRSLKAMKRDAQEEIMEHKRQQLRRTS